MGRERNNVNFSGRPKFEKLSTDSFATQAELFSSQRLSLSDGTWLILELQKRR